MKKKMMMLMVVSVGCIQAMENVDSNAWSITVGTTKINLNKGNVLDTKNKVDCIVMDKYSKPKMDDHNQVARGQFLLNNKHNILEVSVPHISISLYGDVFYERYKPKYELYNAKIWSSYRNQVVVEALRDLELCYMEAFKTAQEKKEKLAKSIALQTPSIGSYTSHRDCKNNRDLENKAAMCIITHILWFIDKNHEVYNCVELFVEEDFEFGLYKELLTTFKIDPRFKLSYWEK